MKKSNLNSFEFYGNLLGWYKCQIFMNILFSLSQNKTDHVKTYIEVLDTLADLGHNVVVLCQKNTYSDLVAKGYKMLHDIKILKSNDFDLIVTSGSRSISIVEKMSGKAGIPVLRLIESYEYALKGIVGRNRTNRLILLNPPIDYPDMLLQLGHNIRWRTPPIFPSTSTDYCFSDPKSPRMIVATEEKTGLLSPAFYLLPFLNKLLNFKITWVTENKGLQKILNVNIKIISGRKADLQQLLAESDIVIANSRLAEQAIAINKPVIIAGDRGYGGLLTEDVFELQYQNQFQGRIGGSPGEFIPEKLLIDDVFDLLEWGNDRINAVTQINRQLLKKKVAAQKALLNMLLHEMLKQHETLSNKLAEARLKLSEVWQLKSFAGNNFALLNNATGQVHSHFETEEAGIIELFREGKQVNEALEESGYGECPEVFTAFIRDLTDEKILVIDGKCE